MMTFELHSGPSSAFDLPQYREYASSLL